MDTELFKGVPGIFISDQTSKLQLLVLFSLLYILQFLWECKFQLLSSLKKSPILKAKKERMDRQQLNILLLGIC